MKKLHILIISVLLPGIIQVYKKKLSGYIIFCLYFIVSLSFFTEFSFSSFIFLAISLLLLFFLIIISVVLSFGVSISIGGRFLFSLLVIGLFYNTILLCGDFADYDSFYISTDTIAPLLKKGDYIISKKFREGYICKKGKPVVFRYPKNSSQIFIMYVDDCIFDNKNDLLKIKVKGNNKIANDSNYWGDVFVNHILGEPLYIYWSSELDRIGKTFSLN